MAQLPEHLKGRTLHIVGPNDDYDEEEEPTGDSVDPEYDQMQVPEDVINKREIIEENNNTEVQSFRLTKHLKEMKQFAPAYTGGSFYIMQGQQYALALNDAKICLYDLNSN